MVCGGGQEGQCPCESITHAWLAYEVREQLPGLGSLLPPTPRIELRLSGLPARAFKRLPSQRAQVLNRLGPVPVRFLSTWHNPGSSGEKNLIEILPHQVTCE